MKKLLLLAFLFISVSTYAQVCPVSDFTETPAPQVNSPVWPKSGWETHQAFSVSIIAGKLQIKKSNFISDPDTVSYNIPGGQLFAHDGGEWGGDLYFIPNDTTSNLYVDGKKAALIKKFFTLNAFKKTLKKLYDTPHINVMGGNIRCIFSYKDSLFFMEGLAHMGINQGAIYKIQFQNNNFQIEKMLDFDDAPRIISVYNKQLCVVTMKRFYIIKNWKKDLILNNIWGYGFYPNSIAVLDSRNIYVGTIDGYAKIDVKTKRLTFYKYKDY